MRRALMWLNLYIVIRLSNITAIFACFWGYVGQSLSHIGWATSMPLASINSTNPRTNPWNFREKKVENWGIWKSQLFWVGHFDFFSKKIIKKNCFIPMNISHKLCDRMDGTQFWCFPWSPANSLLCVLLRYTVWKTRSFWVLSKKSRYLDPV